MTRTLLALDPGGTTGWSVWTYSDTEPLTHVGHGMVKDGLRGFIQFASGVHPDEVLSETFVLDGRTPKPNTEPLRIEGALSVIWPDWIGQRNVMKAHAPDELLKAKGLWWPGAGHDRDSARHAIARMKVTRHAPTLAWLYGKGEE